jgi:2-C-methyl-D-erythritol 4-phosphate cytidylyltransferase
MSSGARASIAAVIAAAGSGERLGAGGPKAFVPLAGRPMLEWSLDAFRAAGVAQLVVAVPGEVLTEVTSSRRLDDGRVGPAEDSTTYVAGGATRAQSVANALEAVETDLVAIHDAARPLVTPELIAGITETLESDPEAAGAIAATPVTDTIKRTARRVLQRPHQSVVNPALGVEETLDRGGLWAAQTPQVFRAASLREALGAHSDPDSATDEAMLVEAAGGRVLIHPSSAENLKVTTPFDLKIAERLLGSSAPQ